MTTRPGAHGVPDASMRTLHAMLPLPPSVNHRWRRSGTGRSVYLAPAARTWRDVAILELRRCGFRSRVPAPCRLTVALVVRARRLDIDNGIKATLDVIAAALGVDDGAVDELAVRRIRPAPREPESVTVTVRMPSDGAT